MGGGGGGGGGGLKKKIACDTDLTMQTRQLYCLTFKLIVYFDSFRFYVVTRHASLRHPDW